MEITINQLTAWILNVYTLIAWLLIVITGTVLGFKQRITVFRNYNDLGLAFLMGLSPIVLTYLFSYLASDQKTIGVWFIIIIEAFLITWTVGRTLKDNPNPLLAFLAFITKISLSVLFIVNFLDFLAPKGKTMSGRASVRHKGLAFLLLIGPLVFALITQNRQVKWRRPFIYAALRALFTSRLIEC